MGTVLTLEERIHAFKKWGALAAKPEPAFAEIALKAKQQNAWFTIENIEKAYSAISSMLQPELLEQWSQLWKADAAHCKPKNVGLILAGNIPMVGFHDILCVLAAGHKALIKLSSQDQVLLPYFLEKLIAIEPAFADKIAFVERLSGFDAVLATGSNNSSRYFDYYFGKVPHIIRKNRTSVAVIHGNESTEEIHALGSDIFNYFGLGCRNVSKLYLPQNYPMARFFEAIEPYQKIAQEHKYLNNYEYNKSIYLVNGETHLDNGFLLTKADTGLHSPLAVLFTETYSSKKVLETELTSLHQEIQCIASMQSLHTKSQVVPFGYTQFPRLWDYADGLDVMHFLCKELSHFSGN